LHPLIQAELRKLCDLLKVPERQFTLFIVVDEVQETIALCQEEPVYTDGITARPILREICRVWSGLSMSRLVLAGTGIDYHAIDEILGSGTFKDRPYAQYHDIGAFDNFGSQVAYIRRYFPDKFAQHPPAWASFLSRAWTWLRGR